jgi:hypothetical protein
MALFISGKVTPKRRRAAMQAALYHARKNRIDLLGKTGNPIIPPAALGFVYNKSKKIFCWALRVGMILRRQFRLQRGKQNYQSIVANGVANGANAVHLMPIPETTQDQSALTAFINATYPTGKKIDVSGAWVNATHLSADGTHPNAAGHTLIANTILANSGLFV